MYDPKGHGQFARAVPDADLLGKCIGGLRRADVVLVLTEWLEFLKLQPSDLDSVVRNKVIVDGRNCLSPDDWQAQVGTTADWDAVSTGRLVRRS